MIALAAVALLAVASPVESPQPGATGSPAAASRDRVSIWVTAKATGDRLASKEPAAFEAQAQPVEDFPIVIVDPSKTFQTIEGIGGALTDASAETFAKLPRESQERLLEAYFDPAMGIGYSLGRTHINSCDFSSESYAYADQAGDVELRSFTIEHDRRHRLPFIKAALARAGAPFKIFASPWSAPAWMKTNGDMLHGGRLKPEYRDAWARYFVRFVQEYEKEGVPIWGLTVQNEPMATQTWESLLFTGEEERDFVRDQLGPALEKAGLSRLKLMIWDHNRGIMYQRAKAVYDDPQAARYVWGTGFHWYVGDHFENVRAVHDAWPDKQLLFTEGTPANFDPATVAGLEVGRDLRPLAPPRPQQLGRGLDRLERAARRAGRPEPRRQLLPRPRARRHAHRRAHLRALLLLHRALLEVREARREAHHQHLERGRPAHDGLRQPGRQRRHDRAEPVRAGPGLRRVGRRPGRQDEEPGALDRDAALVALTADVVSASRAGRSSRAAGRPLTRPIRDWAAGP